jgi:hypothetical protein
MWCDLPFDQVNGSIDPVMEMTDPNSSVVPELYICLGTLSLLNRDN